MHIGHYLTGFTDGEGSFNVSLRKKDYSLGWQISPSFNISQKDESILYLFKKWLGCGKIRQRQDGISYFEVTDLRNISEIIIPFFERFNFLSNSKKTNFRIFGQIIKLMKDGKHLQADGLEKILELREQLNKGRGRKRKYSINDVI